jgi:hypothetical protein
MEPEDARLQKNYELIQNKIVTVSGADNADSFARLAAT